MLPFKRNPFGQTFVQYYLFANILRKEMNFINFLHLLPLRVKDIVMILLNVLVFLHSVCRIRWGEYTTSI